MRGASWGLLGLLLLSGGCASNSATVAHPMNSEPLRSEVARHLFQYGEANTASERASALA